MNLLDENIRHDQGEQLRKWRIHYRRLISELAHPGIQDADIISFLHGAKHPSLFTHDKDYFKRTLIHPRYCLVWLDVYDGEAAEFIHRFLAHPHFDSWAKRMGKVVHLRVERLSFWQHRKKLLEIASWPVRT